MKKLLSRIHIPVSGAIWFTFAAVYIFFVAAQVSPAYGQKFDFSRERALTNGTPAAAVKKIALAQGAGYRTHVMLTALPDASAAVDIAPICGAGSVTIVPNGSLYLRDYATGLCGAQTTFRLADVPKGTNAFSVVSYGGGSFVVPAIGAVDRDHPSIIRGLVNDDQEQTRVTTLTAGSMRADCYGGPDAKFLGTERWLAADGLAQHELQTKMPEGGYLKISVEPTGFGPCPYCADGGTVYGFVTVATPANSNSRSYAFGE